MNLERDVFNEKRKKNMATVINRSFISHLHLYRLAVDELAAGDHRVEDDGCLLARVQDDVVAFPAEIIIEN